MKQYLTRPPSRRYLSSCSPSSQCRVLRVSRISYRLSAGQTKRAARNWVSHLLPDMIDKSLPSVISAKLLFRRAAARARAHPLFLLLLLLLVVLLTIAPPQPASSFVAGVHGVSRRRFFFFFAHSLQNHPRRRFSPTSVCPRIIRN